MPRYISKQPAARATVLALDDGMLAQLMGAAQLLSPGTRDAFLRSCANRLSDIAEPTAADLNDTIQFCLNAQGVAMRTSHFMCDSKSVHRPRRRHRSSRR